MIAIFTLPFLLLPVGCNSEAAAGEVVAELDPRVAALSRLCLLNPSPDQGIEPFFLDCFETTNSHYLEFLGAQAPARFKRDHEGAWPVRNIPPKDAIAFARWRGMRLPLKSEFEWAIGVRLGNEDSFPWGETFDAARWDELRCNTQELCLSQPAPVGTFELGKTSDTFIYDLIGNVAEWVRCPPGSFSDQVGAEDTLAQLVEWANDNGFQDVLAEWEKEEVWREKDYSGEEEEWEGIEEAPLAMTLEVEVELEEPDSWPPGERQFSRIEKLLKVFGLSLEDFRYNTSAISESRISIRRYLREINLVFGQRPGFHLFFALDQLVNLGEEEREALEKPWAWVGWHYYSYIPRAGTNNRERISGRKGPLESSDTVGFRCAAWPRDLLTWLAHADGPPLVGPEGFAIKLFLRKHRVVFSPLTNREGFKDLPRIDQIRQMLR